jgi:hypothetical protein
MTDTDIPSPEEAFESEGPPTTDTIEAWDQEQVNRYNELKEADLREAVAMDTARHEAALAEIAAGEDLERYETVQLGDLDIDVKAWLPGEVERTVQHAQAVAQSEDAERVRESMETMLSALESMTKSDDYNMDFWRLYYERYGPEALLIAVETIMQPASESLEQTKEAVDGFREDVERSGTSPSRGTGGDNP